MERLHGKKKRHMETGRDQGKDGCDKRYIYMKKTKPKSKGKGPQPE